MSHVLKAVNNGPIPQFVTAMSFWYNYIYINRSPKEGGTESYCSVRHLRWNLLPGALRSVQDCYLFQDALAVRLRLVQDE